MSKKPVQKKDEPETTGHSWDGIEEYNNPLPRWWLWSLYASIVWAVLYTIAYPAWPLINGATPGLLGWSTRGEVAKDIAAVDAANAGLRAELEAVEMAVLVAENSPLHDFAIAGGSAIFKANCSQCHGSGAAGAKGYPNLLDDDWLWGGSIDDILFTVTHGVRNEQSFDARYSEMPAFGDILEKDEIGAVVQHVLAISGEEHDADLAVMGSTVFADNCASCHGEDATGDREQGAPNLADAIWLWGGDEATLTTTVERARFGVMPAWNERLSQSEIRSVAAYIHQLGGGE